MSKYQKYMVLYVKNIHSSYINPKSEEFKEKLYFASVKWSMDVPRPSNSHTVMKYQSNLFQGFNSCRFKHIVLQ